MNIKRWLPLIGLAIFIYVLSQLHITKIYHIFININPIYAILSFFIFIPLLLLVTVEWQLLLKSQQIHVSYWYAIKNFFIGYFYGFITPGGVGGYGRAVYLAQESNEPIPKCFSNVIIFNTIELLAMFVPGFIGAIFLSRIYPYLSIIIIGVVVLILILYLYFFKSTHSRQFFKRILQSKIFSNINDKIEGSMDSFYVNLPTLKDIILPFTLSVSGWIFKYIMLYFVAFLFNIHIPFLYFFLIVAVSDVISSIPISIYGIGTREAALIAMFSFPEFTGGVIVGSEQIVSLSLFWFLIIWINPSIIGFFITYFETKKYSDITLDKETCIHFETYMKKYQDLYHKLARIVKKNISPKKTNPIIVDLGAGPGILSYEIKNMLPYSTILAIDPCYNMLELAKQNRDIEVIGGTSEFIPIKDEQVTIVVSRFNLTYWQDPMKGFQEIYRILEPDGKIIIEVLNKRFSKIKLVLIKLHMMFKASGLDIARYHIDAYKTAHTKENIINMLDKSGFRNIQSEGNENDWKLLFVGKKQ